MRTKTLRLTLEYWKDGDWYVGRLRELPGVVSQGKTLGALETNIRDAYRLMMKDRRLPAHADAKAKLIALSA